MRWQCTTLCFSDFPYMLNVLGLRKFTKIKIITSRKKITTSVFRKKKDLYHIVWCFAMLNFKILFSVIIFKKIPLGIQRDIQTTIYQTFFYQHIQCVTTEFLFQMKLLLHLLLLQISV